MANESKTQLKSYFQLGDKPNQAQFENLIDSMVDADQAGYPIFSTSKSYVVGDVVAYGGKFYKFTSAHPAGAWVGTDVTETSIKAETDQKLTDLESKLMGGGTGGGSSSSTSVEEVFISDSEPIGEGAKIWISPNEEPETEEGTGTGTGGELVLYIFGQEGEFNSQNVEEQYAAYPELADIKNFLLSKLEENAHTMSVVAECLSEGRNIPPIRIDWLDPILANVTFMILLGDSPSLDSIRGLTCAGSLSIYPSFDDEGNESPYFLIEASNSIRNGYYDEEGSYIISEPGSLILIEAPVNPDGSLYDIISSSFMPKITINEYTTDEERAKVINAALAFNLLGNVVIQIAGYKGYRAISSELSFNGYVDFVIVRNSQFETIRVGIDGTITENPE